MKFSVTIPAYKAKYLKECIDSILSQTYPKFELIIVNDASPEDLDSIVNSYSDHRIRYFKNEKNCGAVNVVDNWNKCLSYASGDYVICMGDDDKLSTDALEQYVTIIQKYPNLKIYHARTILIDPENKHVGITPDRAEYESIYSFMLHRIEGRMQFIGDFCFKTDYLREINGFYKLPLAWGSDDITAYLAAKEKGIANINTPTFFYRTNPSTISRTGNTKIKLEAINIEYKWYQKFIATLQPNNIVDYETLCLIKNKIENSFIKKKARAIRLDLLHNKISIIRWLFNKKKYHLNYSVLGLAILTTLKSNKQ